MYVFGSRGRGDHTGGSDFDILVIVKTRSITIEEAIIDEILKPVQEVLKTGGYIPFGDHFIPPEVSWENFRNYRDSLNRIIDRPGGIL